MKIPLSWLKKYISVELDPEDLSNILTRSGLEVDKIDRLRFCFSGVVVGKVTAVAPHPEADKLVIATVSDGASSFQVVCGGPNCRADLVVPFAKVGAEIELANGEKLKIKKAKLRGIESYGMLCGADELGFAGDSKSLMELPKDAPLGEDLVVYLKDPTFDVSLTPNLGWCRSMIGVARELSAQLQTPLVPPQFALKETSNTLIQEAVKVNNHAPKECLQYTCRLIEEITVGPSPTWLRDWLTKAGYQSINNVVDATNFVMHELGQPLHAFDFDKIHDKEIEIRLATKEETIISLDGQTRKLPQESLLICDQKGPVAIAGIMGGESSSVTDSTTTILLEAAQFLSTSIRKTSRLLGLRSESSSRFENEIDGGAIKFALDRAASLIAELCGGKIAKGIIEEISTPSSLRFLTCRLSKINSLLGTNLSLGEVESFLSRLNIATTNDGIDLFQLKIPTYRNDIKREIDIIEEVARIYGLENIPRKSPRHISSKEKHNGIYLLEQRIRNRLIAEGLTEFITCDLISPKECDLELDHQKFGHEIIRVLYAKSQDQSVLRPSLLPSLLSSVKHNQNLSPSSINAFELGRIHFKKKDEYHEDTALGIILAGTALPHHWSTKSPPVDFYDLKGIVENLFDALHIRSVKFPVSSFKAFHPGRQTSIQVADKTFGVIGELHPSSLSELGIDRRVLYAELDLQELSPFIPDHVTLSPLPQYPSSDRDWTVTMKKQTSLDRLLRAIESLDSPYLKKTSLLDVYEGENIAPNMKNVTFRFTYRDDNKTLEIEEIEKEHANNLKRLEKQI